MCSGMMRTSCKMYICLQNYAVIDLGVIELWNCLLFVRQCNRCFRNANLEERHLDSFSPNIDVDSIVYNILSHFKPLQKQVLYQNIICFAFNIYEKYFISESQVLKLTMFNVKNLLQFVYTLAGCALLHINFMYILQCKPKIKYLECFATQI